MGSDQSQKLPYSAVGYLVSSFDDQEKDVRCSTAVLIRENVALTCAHNCLKGSQKAKHMHLFMGLNTKAPAKFEVQRSVFLSDLQETCDCSKDFALLFFKEYPGTTYGYLGTAFNEPINENKVSVIGYPYMLKGKLMGK